MNVEIRFCTVARETEKAYLIRQTIRGDSIEVWVPKSMMDYVRKQTCGTGPTEITFSIPESFAVKKNLHH